MGKAYRLSQERLLCNPSTSHAARFIVCGVLWILSGSWLGKGEWAAQDSARWAATSELNSTSPKSPARVNSKPGAWVDAESLSPAEEFTGGWLSALARKDAWEGSRITGGDARCTAESECFGSVLPRVLTSVPEMNTLLDF